MPQFLRSFLLAVSLACLGLGLVGGTSSLGLHVLLGLARGFLGLLARGFGVTTRVVRRRRGDG